MNKFKVEEQYQLYLNKIKLPEHSMHPVQRQQLKDTFYAAWGQLLLLQRNEVSKLNEEDTIDSLELMFQQVSDYWRMKNSVLKKMQRDEQIMKIVRKGSKGKA